MMAAKTEDMEAHHHEEEQQPLLVPEPSDEDRMTVVQQAISQTFKSAAHLANHLPTGTVLAFQVLSPILTNSGRCSTDANRIMTACLLALCGISCFTLSFTDSFHDAAGKIRYGLATFKGIWMIDGAAPLPPEIAANYSVKFRDFLHAFISVFIFAAVALFDKNVVSCFYPVPSKDMEQVLAALPVAIGVFGSGVFVAFPTTRHGIGFPVSSP